MELMRQNRDLVTTMDQIRADTVRQIEQVQERNRMLESQLEFTKVNLTSKTVEADSFRVFILLLFPLPPFLLPWRIKLQRKQDKFSLLRVK